MIGISNLIYSLRPFLNKWHPLLLNYESSRKEGISIISHEKKWAEYENFFKDLKNVRDHLISYANLLCEILKIKKLHESS